MKELIRSTLRRVGLDVRGYSFATSYEDQFRRMLARHEINLIMDVGANVGQFSAELRGKTGYRGRIVSFEPSAVAHAELLRASANDPLWEVAPRAAVGASAGSVMLHIAGNSQSSSVLPMLDAHASAAPESRYVSAETVPLITLDAVAGEYVRNESRIFLKIDTQGYEADALRGAAKLLSRSTGVQLEMSLTPLYEGQLLMKDLSQMLQDAGFDLWALSPVFVDPQSGRLLQLDATFFRAGNAGV